MIHDSWLSCSYCSTLNVTHLTEAKIKRRNNTNVNRLQIFYSAIRTRHSIHRHTDMQLNSVAHKSALLHSVQQHFQYTDCKTLQPTHSLLHTCHQLSMETLQHNLQQLNSIQINPLLCSAHSVLTKKDEKYPTQVYMTPGYIVVMVQFKFYIKTTASGRNQTKGRSEEDQSFISIRL